MTTFLRLSLLGSLLTAATVAPAATNPTPTWETPPGWTETRGGAGGKVIRVTTLAPRGAGSLDAALATEKRPRHVRS